MQQLLAAATDAAASNEFSFARGDTQPYLITAPGLAGAETATLQFWNGSAYQDYQLEGEANPVQLTATSPFLHIHPTNGYFRIDKSATAAAVPVNLQTERNNAKEVV